MIQNSLFGSYGSSKRGPLKDLKNRESRAFTFDAQRIHKIELRAIQLLNQYFQKIQAKQKITQQPKKEKQHLSKFQQLRNRFFHLSPQNQQEITQEMNKVKHIYQDVYRSEELKEMEKKLSRVKTSSSTLDNEIKLYQQHLIEGLRDLNLQGNEWIEMNLNSKIKQEWRKRNLQEVRQYKANHNDGFFYRNITTDYETEKKKIVSNINKLRLLKIKSLQQRQMQKNLIMPPIGEQRTQYEGSNYENQNKFIQRFWNTNKSRASSLQTNYKSRKNFISNEKLIKNQQKFGLKINLDELMKFQDKYHTLGKSISRQKQERNIKIRRSSDKLKIDRTEFQESNIKLTRKWSQSAKQNVNQDSTNQFSETIKFNSQEKNAFQTMKNREVKFKILHEKINFQPSKTTKKLVL